MSNKKDLSSIQGVDLSEEALDGATGGGGYKSADLPDPKGQGAKVSQPAKTKEGFSIRRPIIFYK